MVDELADRPLHSENEECHTEDLQDVVPHVMPSRAQDVAAAAHLALTGCPGSAMRRQRSTRRLARRLGNPGCRKGVRLGLRLQLTPRAGVGGIHGGPDGCWASLDGPSRIFARRLSRVGQNKHRAVFGPCLFVVHGGSRLRSVADGYVPARVQVSVHLAAPGGGPAGAAAERQGT